ncbi:uncharacterized protein LOC130718171 isoform X2 [Lotus japonicus]|uniref:uncharacterized protein LOC130718171 isoform X2 n=1 Tax=Lotus japonicus TaxID=34305 RepID=UPI002586B220|nr:uncharacterized protein LOC130718171 isoform X2 [Lotus japonicus]
MDKPRNVRCGSNVFSNSNKRRHVKKKHIGRPKKLLGVFSAAIRGDLQFSAKSKKLRSLSAVSIALTSSQQHCQMGYNVSEEQAHDQPSSSTVSKRFKIPKNFLNGCNGVHHAVVPRKIRSAMKKRNRESILLDSEKVNHKISGTESTGKDSVKKSKKKQRINPDWSPRGVSVSGPITKDEEEVAETLFALAGMFHNNGSKHNVEGFEGLQGEPMPENSTVLQDLKEHANVALEGSATARGPESSLREASRISSINETSGQEQAVVVKRENRNNVALPNSELCLAMGLNMTLQSRISQIERKPDVKFQTATDVDSKQKQGQLGNEGLTLWPSFSSVASPSQANHQFFFSRTIAAKAPDWLEAAICASKHDMIETSTCSSSGKISEVATHKRSWKRCAAHVHISHYIKSLEVPKGQVIKEPEIYECHQMRAHEGSKHGVLLEVHSLNRMRNGVPSATVRNPQESQNCILQQQCHYGDISLAAPTTEVYGTQKQQSFNFLSLSVGSDGLKVDNNYNKIEPLSKFQVPYLQSLAQQYGVMPLHSQYASTSYQTQLSVAAPQVRLQQPHYNGSMIRGTQYSSTVSSKQEQQNFWGVQQAAQSRSAVNCNIIRTQYPNWQSGRNHHSSAGSPCVQAIIPHFPASQEIFGSKITSISISGKQQHQQLIPPIQDRWARPTSPFCL